jgi:outer membrane receptor protein involved in Fe transport
MCILASNASAQGNADEAELQFQLGAEAYQRGDFRDALEHFLASNRLVPNRNVIFNIGRAYERLAAYPSAHRYYVDALEAETEAARRAEIEDALRRVGEHVGVVDVITDPPGATIYVGRRDLGSVGVAPRPLAFEPGTYHVIVALEGHHPAEADVEATRGARSRLELSLERIVGRVVLAGEEGIEARLDSDRGDPVCVVPCSFETTPGAHVLFFSRPGRSGAQRPISVRAGQTTRVSVDLQALTGSILVRADERDALVEVDGEPRGFTPAVVPNVPVGMRRVRVSLRGFRPVEREVEVRQGEQSLVDDVELVPTREVEAASRTTETVEDAPASVTIVSAQEIEAFQYPTVFEALRGVRGVALSNDGTYPAAAVRGLGQPNDYNNRILVLSDGASLNENVLYQAYLGYDARLDLGGLERIEVVRGPGSVLYGTGAVSGVINLVPDDRDAPTRFEVSAGTADTNVARARVAFNWRAGDDTGVRASVSGAHSDGWDAPLSFDADGDGVAEENIAHGMSALDALHTAGRAWAGPFTLQWHYNLREVEIPTGTFETIFDDPRNRYTDGRGLLEVRFEPELSDAVSLLTRVHGNLGHYDAFNTYEDDATGGGTYEYDYFEDSLGVWVGGEARVVVALDESFEFSIGGAIDYHPVVDYDASQELEDGTIEQSLDLASPFLVYALYGLVDWTPVEWLTLSAGVRADVWDLDEPAENFVSPSPRVAFILRPTENDTLKVMGGRAFRAPSIYELYYEGTPQLASSCCGTALGPESFYQAEIEYTHRFDAQWSVLGAVHAVYALDFITTLPAPTDPDNSIYFANSSADQILAGADVELRREFRGGWMFAAQYGFLQARYLEAPIEVGGTDNTRVPNAPEHYASVKGVFPLIPGVLVGAGRMTLEAPRRVRIDSDDVTEWAVVADFVLSGRVDEFGLRWALGVYNLFDWEYDLPADPFAAPVLPQPRRTFFLQVGLQI